MLLSNITLFDIWYLLLLCCSSFPVTGDQEDQAGKLNGEDNEEDITEKRWGNRLRWMKKWENRVDSKYDVGGGSEPSWSKRWKEWIDLVFGMEASFDPYYTLLQANSGSSRNVRVLLSSGTFFPT